MPIFAPEPATTVRQQSPWRLPKLAYGVIFLTVATAAYGWKLSGPRPLTDDIPRQATARVCIHNPNFAFQQAWQEILAQAKSEVRDNLHMEAQRSGRETVVAISLSSLPAETLVRTVNVVASAYSQACRAQWKVHAEQAHSAAQAQVQQVERQASAAQKRFESLRQHRLQALTNLWPPVAPSQPATVENPRWTEICHRLADLEERKRTLLLQRTPLHPSVQEIDMRINDVQREMASLPPKITQEPAGVSPRSSVPPEAPAAAEVQAAQQAAEQLKHDLHQAQSLERAALAARGEELRIDLLAAEPLPPPPHAGTAFLGKALATATTAVLGLGMVSFGASLEPALSSVAELQALLPAPVVGVISATLSGRRRTVSPLRRRLTRWGSMTAGLAVLFSVAWLFFQA